jgi:predicted ester cyclase
MSAKTTMTPEEMKELVKRAAIQPWNDGNLTAFEELFAATYKHADGRDKATIKQSIEATRLSFPDLHVIVNDQIVEGDKVVTRWTAHGTHQGHHYGVPGTDKKMINTGIGIDRIVNGKIVESWGNSDELGVFKQLGLVP